MKAAALLIGFSLTYGGMLCFCLSMERHWKQLGGQRFPAALRRAAKPVAAVLLALALYAALGVWPGGMAVVGWFGLLCLGGMTVLLLLPYAPRLALWLPLGSGVVGVLLALL